MSDLVLLARYDTAMDAHFARGLLARRGIRAVVDGESTGTAWGIPLGATDGIRLVVRREDLEAAAAVTAEAAGAPVPALEEDDPTTPSDPSNAADAWARRMRAFAIVLLPITVVAGIGFFPVFLLLTALPVFFSRRIRELSPVGRTRLRHARIAVAVLAALVVLPPVLWFATRR